MYNTKLSLKLTEKAESEEIMYTPENPSFTI